MLKQKLARRTHELILAKKDNEKLKEKNKQLTSIVKYCQSTNRLSKGESDYVEEMIRKVDE
ncbi:hypothetical protein CBF30_04265 [Vagococcus entomophilus]|uniref:Uncharacterized protein n=1 Tax=Vagococcus entomophilus TaxID=1160095 RepID=A0A430AK33_9ENTE|nr:hypothetical protein CBF30_04265 [Vagococcus entomophilus]